MSQYSGPLVLFRRALGRRELHGFAAAAGAGLVRIVEDELRRQLVGLVVHLGAEQEQHRLRIDQDLDALVLDHLVGRLHRVGVKNGGCAGMAYTMEYADAVKPSDEEVEDKGVKILVDPKAVLFLLGTEMDYKADKLSAQFVFNNPNQTGACGCGESVQLSPAKGAAE